MSSVPFWWVTISRIIVYWPRPFGKLPDRRWSLTEKLRRGVSLGVESRQTLQSWVLLPPCNKLYREVILRAMYKIGGSTHLKSMFNRFLFSVLLALCHLPPQRSGPSRYGSGLRLADGPLAWALNPRVLIYRVYEILYPTICNRA